MLLVDVNQFSVRASYLQANFDGGSDDLQYPVCVVKVVWENEDVSYPFLKLLIPLQTYSHALVVFSVIERIKQKLFRVRIVVGEGTVRVLNQLRSSQDTLISTPPPVTTFAKRNSKTTLS